MAQRFGRPGVAEVEDVGPSTKPLELILSLAWKLDGHDKTKILMAIKKDDLLLPSKHDKISFQAQLTQEGLPGNDPTLLLVNGVLVKH